MVSFIHNSSVIFLILPELLPTGRYLGKLPPVYATGIHRTVLLCYLTFRLRVTTLAFWDVKPYWGCPWLHHHLSKLGVCFWKASWMASGRGRYCCIIRISTLSLMILANMWQTIDRLLYSGDCSVWRLLYESLQWLHICQCKVNY